MNTARTKFLLSNLYLGLIFLKYMRTLLLSHNKTIYPINFQKMMASSLDEEFAN